MPRRRLVLRLTDGSRGSSGQDLSGFMQRQIRDFAPRLRSPPDMDTVGVQCHRKLDCGTPADGKNPDDAL